MTHDTLPPIVRCHRCDQVIVEAAGDGGKLVVCLKCIGFGKSRNCGLCGRAKNSFGFCESCYHPPE